MILTCTASLWLTLFLATISAAAAQNRGCKHDNCLRAFIATSSAASAFCNTFTVGSVPSPAPAFASRCTGDKTSRMKSACSCLNTSLATPTSKSSSTTSSSMHTSKTTSSKVTTSTPSSIYTSTTKSSSKSSVTVTSSSINTSTTKSSTTSSTSVTSSSTHPSTTKSSTTSSVSTTSSAPAFPTCAPSFTLFGVSEDAFNSANQPFQLVLACSSLDTSNYTVYANFQPVIGTKNSSSGITIPGQLPGYTLLTVLGLDTTGTPILQSFQLLFGVSTMQVHVLNAAGQPVAGATVQANATTYVNVGQTAITDATGSVTFINVPSTTIGLKATTADNQIGVDGFAGGSDPSVTIKLVPLLPPVNGTSGFGINNGTSDWTGGSVQTISKRDINVMKRDVGLVVFTNYSPDVQMAYKSFNLQQKATTTYIVYQFQTDEFPGGYFGTQFNDYFSITIRTDDGESTSIFHSMNELGAGAFDANGFTQWYTVQMDISQTATFVEYNVAVSNVADALYQSQVIVSRVGLCDKCATCDDCPSLAKCQDICLNPPQNSCAFYQTCAEETLGCGPSGFPLAYGLQTCNKFQNSIDQFSATGQTWFLNTEQCLQQALVPLLTCDGLCDTVKLTGFNSIPDCYNANNFCSLEGMDYVLIMTTLKDDLYRNSLKQAVVLQSGCSKQIVDTITTTIQQKVADAAAGNDILQNLADAVSLAIAIVFYQKFNSDGALPDIDTAVKYIHQVYNTAVDYQLADPNLLAMDYLRYRKYNDWQWVGLVGTIPPAWIAFAAYEGLQFYDTYPDPAAPPIAIGLDHLYATMTGVYLYGDSTTGDITGWLGDLYTFYGDWQHSGVASGSAFCQQNLGQQTQSTWGMVNFRQDADGYNTGTRLRANPSLSLADEFQNTVQGGGYASRFKNFFNVRFGGSAATASAKCMTYMTVTLLNPEAWYVRHSLTNRFYKVPFPENIPQASLQDFCNGFAGVLQNFAASG